jgi:hypothetical protein
MSKTLHSNDDISLCYKDNCIQASGQNGKLIAFGAFALLILIGIAAISRNN